MEYSAIKVLVVEDDPFIQDMLASILESAGYLIVKVANGQEALDMLVGDAGIQLIVSDVNMPVMDGLQLIKEVRSRGLEVPIIMVTGVTSIAVAVDALSSGAIDYVLKDEGIENTIIITVKRALAKHQLKLHNMQLVADLARKTTELENTLSSLTAIISNMPDGLLVADADRRIALANPALGRMFAIDETQLIGKKCQQAFHGNLAPLFEMTLASSGRAAAVSMDLANGHAGSAVAAAIGKKNPAGADRPEEFLGNLVIVRDVTSEREIERMKDDFLSTVSHELRTPLTSVLGFAKVIARKLNDVVFPLVPTVDAKTVRTVQQIGDNLAIIVAEGERLTALINDVLDISKMEAGKVEWKHEPASIPGILEHAIAATRSLFERKEVGIVTEIAADLPPVCCDRDRIIQVAINLLSNAVKFTDRGSVSVAARRRRPGDPPLADGGDFVVVAVSDTGIGIADRDIKNIFEKFKQVGDTLTDRPKGSGLGLPICRQIVESHGGRIWAESCIGSGSVFSFTLPVAAGPEGA